MAHKIEVIVRGKSGAGKTTIAMLVARHLECCGLSVAVDDEGQSLPDIVPQALKSLNGGYIKRAEISVRTEQERK